MSWSALCVFKVYVQPFVSLNTTSNTSGSYLQQLYLLDQDIILNSVTILPFYTMLMSLKIIIKTRSLAMQSKKLYSSIASLGAQLIIVSISDISGPKNS